MVEQQQAVRIEHAHLAMVRHPIKAARLLYTAPAWVLAGPIYLITLITFAGLAFSFWATKNELVNAPLVLERELAVVEAVQGGRVARIFVHEGDQVSTLAPLVEVQKTRISDRNEQESLKSKESEVLKEMDTARAEFEHSLKQLKLSLEQANLSVKTVRKDREIMQQQLKTTQRNVSYRTKKLNQAKKNLKEEKALYDARDITRVEYDRARSKVDDLEKSVNDANAEKRNLEISLRSLNEDRIRNDIKQVKNEITQLKARYQEKGKRQNERLASLAQQMKDEKSLLGDVSHERGISRYSSSFSGLVTKVHVKMGHMISPGAPLVTIVKDTAALEGRALVLNKDIGRMKRGQKVQIKYFAYPYQAYGIPTGVISDIATKPGGVAGQESMYVVRIALHEEVIKVTGKRDKPLAIGLEGIAEIKTGEKRLIELMFSPISRFFTQEEE